MLGSAGGSGHINDDEVSDGSMQTGVNEGDGKAVVTQVYAVMAQTILKSSSEGRAHDHPGYSLWSNSDTHGIGGTANFIYGQSVNLFFKAPGETYSLDASATSADRIPRGFELDPNERLWTPETTFGGPGFISYGKTLAQPANNVIFNQDLWPIYYPITYDLDGGTNDPANPADYNVLEGVTFGNPYRAGYRFTGWTDVATGKRVSGVNVGKSMPTGVKSASELDAELATRSIGAVEVRANWEPVQGTLAYKAQTGGSVSPASEAVSGSGPAAGSTATADAGCTFDGWYSGTRKVSDSASYAPPAPTAVPKGYLSAMYGDGTSSYDESSDTYTVSADFSTRMDSHDKQVWGSGVSLSAGGMPYVPYGSALTVSFDIMSPVEASMRIDNNNSYKADRHGDSNDNDDLDSRRLVIDGAPTEARESSFTLKAGEWTRVSYRIANTASGNTAKSGLYDYSAITMTQPSGFTGKQDFYIRGMQGVVTSAGALVDDASVYTAHFRQNMLTFRFHGGDGSDLVMDGSMVVGGAGERKVSDSSVSVPYGSGRYGVADGFWNPTSDHFPMINDALADGCHADSRYWSVGSADGSKLLDGFKQYPTAQDLAADLGYDLTAGDVTVDLYPRPVRDSYTVTVPTRIEHDGISAGDVDISDSYVVTVRGACGKSTVHVDASVTGQPGGGLSTSLARGKADWSAAEVNAGTTATDTVRTTGTAAASGSFTGLVSYSASLLGSEKLTADAFVYDFGGVRP